jgi:hypothetical protein
MALKRKVQDEDIAQELILESDSDAHISEDDISPPQSDSDTEEDTTDTGCRDWTNTRQSEPSAPVIHKFTGRPSGLRQNEAPHINKDSSPLRVSCSFFHEIMQLLEEETNRYYHQYLYKLLLKDALHCPT